jgi:hypothetical protein
MVVYVVLVGITPIVGGTTGFQCSTEFSLILNSSGSPFVSMFEAKIAAIKLQSPPSAQP